MHFCVEYPCKKEICDYLKTFTRVKNDKDV